MPIISKKLHAKSEVSMTQNNGVIEVSLWLPWHEYQPCIESKCSERGQRSGSNFQKTFTFYKLRSKNKSPLPTPEMTFNINFRMAPNQFDFSIP